MTPIYVILSVILFSAMILVLAQNSSFTRRIISMFMLISALGGLVLYGIGFSSVLTDPMLKIVRTIIAVCRMFVGVNEFGSISSAPIFRHSWVVSLFWLLHLAALYATGSAAIATLGAAALKRIRYRMERFGRCTIIYGIDSDTVELGRSLASAGTRNIVYVGGNPDANCEKAIDSMGGLVRRDPSALKPDLVFLRSLGAGKGSPKLTLYAVDSDESKNPVYAAQLLSALEGSGVSTANIGLVLRSTDESTESDLLQTDGRFGYGEVRTYSDVSVAARLLMQRMPPCEKAEFLPDCSSRGIYDAVIAGFGKTGRNVLRCLVRSAQFEGCHLRIAVFDPEAECENGYFRSSYPHLLENYDISFFGSESHSTGFYDYLRQYAHTIRYIVVCEGDRDRETCAEISSFLSSLHSTAAVCRCSPYGIAWNATPDAPVQAAGVYSSGVITSDAVDKMAIMLNYSYVNDTKITPRAAWNRCSYFDRESSRAAADFCKAYLKITGRDEASVAADGWGELTAQQKENLGRTEHLRWTAFHYSMGFSPMSDEAVMRRGEQFLSEAEAFGHSGINICKDLYSRQHACMRQWEELDALACLEERYTGVKRNYKDYDVRNVMALPQVLRAAKELAE